jgi:hypothetical protein
MAPESFTTNYTLRERIRRAREIRLRILYTLYIHAKMQEHAGDDEEALTYSALLSRVHVPESELRAEVEKLAQQRLLLRTDALMLLSNTGVDVIETAILFESTETGGFPPISKILDHDRQLVPLRANEAPFRR